MARTTKNVCHSAYQGKNIDFWSMMLTLSRLVLGLFQKKKNGDFLIVHEGEKY